MTYKCQVFFLVSSTNSYVRDNIRYLIKTWQMDAGTTVMKKQAGQRCHIIPNHNRKYSEWLRRVFLYRLAVTDPNLQPWHRFFVSSLWFIQITWKILSMIYLRKSIQLNWESEGPCQEHPARWRHRDLPQPWIFNLSLSPLEIHVVGGFLFCAKIQNWDHVRVVSVIWIDDQL